MPKTHAYLRVSTDKQDLENQRQEIEAYAQTKGLSIDQWHEVTISTRKNSRERGIDSLLSNLRRGDTLIVSELSRLARSIREIHNLIEELSKRKVYSHFIKQGLVTNGEHDLTTKILINAFSVAAELERDLISQRTKNGLARVKGEGKKLGNPNLAQINKNTVLRANEYAESLRPILEGLVMRGMTQRAIMEELNRQGIKSRQGASWHLPQVQATLKRLGLKTKAS
jgi:putative DNA-invertase from lambdoid prophage Rac